MVDLIVFGEWADKHSNDSYSELATMKSRPSKSSQQSSTEYQQLEPRQLLATITVNTTDDFASEIPDGKISLREAIIAANTNEAYGDAPAGDPGYDYIRSGVGQNTIQISREFVVTEDVAIRNFSIDAAESSRIFRTHDAGKFTLSRSILQNGRADSGGAILAVNTELDLTNVEFLNNHADIGNGGAIKTVRGSLKTNVTTFGNNNAAGNGGALAVRNGYWEDSSSGFNTNSSGESGGAIHNDRGVIKLENTKLTFNETNGGGNQGGGALFSEQGASNTLINVIFENNEAANGNGGAILGRNSRAISVRNSEFSNNTARKNGGAIHLDNDNFYVVDTQYHSSLPNSSLSTFERNSATQNGGAISAINGSYVVMAGIEANRNIAGTAASAKNGMGGAIFSVNSSIELNGDTVKISGRAFHAGGAIAVIGGRLRLESGLRIDPSNSQESWQRLSGNEISGRLSDSDSNETKGLKAGNVIYAVNANVKVHGFRVQGSLFLRAERGGAIFLSHSRASINNSAIYGSVARFGGAVFSTNHSFVCVLNSTINSNTAWLGGSLFSNHDTTTVVTHSFFDAGHAFHSGGGIHNKGNLTITGSQFTRNRAYKPSNWLLFDDDSTGRFGRGGAVYNEGRLVVGESSFHEGYAGWGGGIAGDGNMSIFRSKFEGNRTTMNEVDFVDGYGGAISSDAQTLILGSVSFTSNIAAHGGAVSVNGGVLYGRNLMFGGDTEESGNNTYGTEEVRGEGGALRLSGSAGATLINATFKNNSASTFGGAVALVANGQIVPYLFTSRTRFENNSVISGAPTTALSNMSQSGGAIANDGGKLDLRDAWFSQNTAAGHGGAIANSGRIELRNVQIRDNHADLLGGAIFNDAKLSIFDSIISDNEAHVAFGGIFETIDSKTNLIRTRVERNSF